MNQVILLFEGYSTQIDEVTMDANCSCILIKGLNNIIIDTMTAWDKDEIIKALHKEDLNCEDINYVICTHSHADHIGNNNLFFQAQEHIIGTCVQKKTLFYEKNLKNEEYKICEGVRIISTPGHTEDDVSIVVEGSFNNKNQIIAITGDLFEKVEDIDNPSIWIDMGNPTLRNIQALSRQKIINLADTIIPGHGPPFIVTNEMREKITAQLNAV